MIPRAAAALLLPLLLLPACGGEGGGETGNTRSIRIANPHDERLKALSEPMQHLGLMRAVRDDGKRCKRVDAAAYQEEHRGLAMWVARCSDSGAWAVFISPTGDLQVRACDEAAQLELPECRLPEGAAAEG